MVDQNNIGTQTNGQVAMVGNPYDLVDNKNVVLDSIDTSTQVQTPIQNVIPNQQFVQVPTQETIQQVQPVIQQVSPIVQQNIPVQQVAVQQNQVPVEKGPGSFIKGLIKFIAKVSGQPDPKTGKPTVVASTNPNTVIPQVGVNQPVQKSGNAFENIMGGVTGFLDKVEKKIENAAGVDLDSMIKMPEKPVQPVVQTPIQENIPPVQNLEEKKTVVVKDPISDVVVENTVAEEVVEKAPVVVPVVQEEKVTTKVIEPVKDDVIPTPEPKVEVIENKNTGVDLNNIS